MQRIVLVDEDPVRCHDASEALSAAEYQVTECLELDSAFVRVCGVQPHLVIVDDPNHVRRGCELLNQLKQQQETAAIPVLVNWPVGTVLATGMRTLEERGVHLLPPALPSQQLAIYVAELLDPR